MSRRSTCSWPPLLLAYVSELQLCVVKLAAECGLAPQHSASCDRKKRKELSLPADPERYELHAKAVVGPVTLVD